MRLTNLAYVLIAVFWAGCTDSGQPRGNLSGSERPPKNVIILIADGGGFKHFKSADYYRCGRITCQAYEKFPLQLAMQTSPHGGRYDANAVWGKFDNVKKGATDSAAAATAMATGVKTYNAGLGVDVNKNPVLNLLERAEQLGKTTGVITSVPFSHATPAGFVAHNADRDNYTQIAAEMINNSAADVVMGCGHPLYNANGGLAGSRNYKYISAADWTALSNGSAGGDADADGIADPWKLTQTRAEFQALAKGNTPQRVFGLAQVYETLQQKRSGNSNAAPYLVPMIQSVPTLEELTNAALNVLDDDRDGFFLMIEGGAVDWASHGNESGRLIEEMNDFNNSIDAVIKWVDKNTGWNETLVIITADHETGYLTGLPRRSPSAKPGPGSGQQTTGAARGELVEPVWNDPANNGPGKLPDMQWNTTKHTNSLVPFFAKGAGAALFKDAVVGRDPVRGPYIDNTDIANVIFSLWPND